MGFIGIISHRNKFVQTNFCTIISSAPKTAMTRKDLEVLFALRKPVLKKQKDCKRLTLFGIGDN